MTKKPLRIGLVGYGFMGRTHSNAFARVNQFFDLPYRPLLQAVCARDAAKVAAFAEQWGYGIGGDRLAQAGGAAGYRSDRYRQPQRYARGDRHRRGRRREDGALREAAGPQRRGIRAHGGGRGEGRRAEYGLVQLPARARRHAGQAVDRRGPPGQNLPLSGEVSAGLDHLGRPAAGRRGPLASGHKRGRQRRNRRSAGPLHRHRHVAERRHRPGDGHDRNLRQRTPAQR